MRIAIAALLFLLDLAALTWVSQRLRRRPLPFAASIGLGLLVGWQAVVSLALSPLSLVNGVSLGIAACVPPVVALLLAARSSGGVVHALRRALRSLRWSLVAYGWATAVVVPLAVVLVVVAAAYAPSNWDSMTYHLARVAHWIGRGSVLAYDTNVYRQTLYSPGAEYILLGLQSISGSDRLASGLQLLSWFVVVGSAGPLARTVGAPRAVASWAGPIVAGAPMLVLQATSTQNDLVASVLAVSVAAASLPFLHRAPRARPSDLLLLASMLATAFLVKASAIVVTAPIIVLSAPGVIRSVRAWPGRKATAALAASVALAAVVAGPQLARMATADDRATPLTTPYVFPLLGEWKARAENLRLATTRHFPASTRLAPDGKGTPAALPPFHEDLAANPVQATFILAGLLLLLLGWPKVPSRARWGGAAFLASWVLFQMVFRSNPWVSRLETPLFAFLPTTMGGWGRLRRRGSPRGSPRRPDLLGPAIAGTFGLAAIGLGLVAAVLNTSRPALRALSPRDEAADYYVNRPEPRQLHDTALEVAAEVGCRRIGLFVGEDSFDYPLTWRAMQRGDRVQHVLGPDPWPCVLVSDRGPPPPLGPGEARWQPVLHVLSGTGPDASIAGGVWVRGPARR